MKKRNKTTMLEPFYTSETPWSIPLTAAARASLMQYRCHDVVAELFIALELDGVEKTEEAIAKEREHFSNWCEMTKGFPRKSVKLCLSNSIAAAVSDYTDALAGKVPETDVECFAAYRLTLKVSGYLISRALLNESVASLEYAFCRKGGAR